MSADNGVYILKTVIHSNENGVSKPIDCYRVAHIQSIDDIEYFVKNQPYNIGAYIYLRWKDSPVFHNYKDAFDYAKKVAQCYPILEYGIEEINLSDFGIDQHNFIFFGD